MQKLIKTTCAIAAEEIGKERAGHIAVKAQERFRKLCLENASDPKALRVHTFKRIYRPSPCMRLLQKTGLIRKKLNGISASISSASQHPLHRIFSG